MTCPACGAENEEGSSFCFRCGRALQPRPAQPATGQTISLTTAPPPGAARTYNSPPADAPRYGSDTGTGYGASHLPPAPVPQGGGAPGPYVMPGGTMIPVTNTAAIAALVMSVLSYFVLPFIGSVIGIILGYRARSSIRASQGRESGEGLATAGIILGWIHIALFVLVILVLCVVFGGIVGNARNFR